MLHQRGLGEADLDEVPEEVPAELVDAVQGLIQYMKSVVIAVWGLIEVEVYEISSLYPGCPGPHTKVMSVYDCITSLLCDYYHISYGYYNIVV